MDQLRKAGIEDMALITDQKKTATGAPAARAGGQ